MSTNKSALYAFDAETGHCLWSAPRGSGGLPNGEFALGPAISGNFVVMGAGTNVFIYRFRGPIIALETPQAVVPWWELIGPWPGPDPIRPSPDEGGV